MRIHSRLMALSVLTMVGLGLLTSSPSATAQESVCASQNASNILRAQGVALKSADDFGAYLDKLHGRKVCLVWFSDRSRGNAWTRFTFDKTATTLWITETEGTVKKTYKRVETFTQAGRQALRVDTVKSSYKTVTRVNGDKKISTYRNVDGSKGRRVSVTRTSRSGHSNKVSIKVTGKKGRATTIKVNEKCDVQSRIARCVGSITSSVKAYRGSFNVALKEKASQGLWVSTGLARSGVGARRYNKEFQFEKWRFGITRNGYARSR